MSLLFVDTETTGLDPAAGHVPWEVAIVEPDGTEHHWIWRPSDGDLEHADPIALDIGKFHDRAPDRHVVRDEADAAQAIVELVEGNIIVGSKPAFDIEMLTPWLRRWGYEPAWHHRPICIATLTYGWLTALAALAPDAVPYGILELPWRSDDLARAIGVDPDGYDRHTALGDARWVRDWHTAVGSLVPPVEAGRLVVELTDLEHENRQLRDTNDDLRLRYEQACEDLASFLAERGLPAAREHTDPLPGGA